MPFKNLSNTQQNILKTVLFYAVYVALTFLSFEVLPGGYNGLGRNALLLLLSPFVIGLLVLVNAFRTFRNREHLGSLVLHSLVLLTIVTYVLMNS